MAIEAFKCQAALRSQPHKEQYALSTVRCITCCLLLKAGPRYIRQNATKRALHCLHPFTKPQGLSEFL